MFCQHGISVFDLEVTIPEVNIPVTGQLLEEKMLLPDSGIFSSPVYPPGASTLRFTKDRRACRHDPRTAWHSYSPNLISKSSLGRRWESGALSFASLPK